MIRNDAFNDFFTDIKEETFDCFVKLVHPKLKTYNGASRNYKILQALLELNVQNDDEFDLLSNIYKNLLHNKQNIEDTFKSSTSNLKRLIDILTEFYVDKNKFKGINVRNKLEMFVDSLKKNYENETSLLEIFCEH